MSWIASLFATFGPKVPFTGGFTQYLHWRKEPIVAEHVLCICDLWTTSSADGGLIQCRMFHPRTFWLKPQQLNVRSHNTEAMRGLFERAAADLKPALRFNNNFSVILSKAAHCLSSSREPCTGFSVNLKTVHVKLRTFINQSTGLQDSTHRVLQHGTCSSPLVTAWDLILSLNRKLICSCWRVRFFWRMLTEKTRWVKSKSGTRSRISLTILITLQQKVTCTDMCHSFIKHSFNLMFLLSNNVYRSPLWCSCQRVCRLWGRGEAGQHPSLLVKWDNCTDVLHCN